MAVRLEHCLRTASPGRPVLLVPGAFTGVWVGRDVVGRTGDHVIPQAEVRRTADPLNARCRVFEGYSQTPSVEPGWELIAANMADWIDRLPAR